MKKVLLASIMVSLMVVTVFHVGFSANAISIRNKKMEDEETTAGYTIEVYTINSYEWMTPGEGLGGVTVTLESKDGTYYKVKRSGWGLFYPFAHCYFHNVPDGKEYTVSGWKRLWKHCDTRWVSKTRVNLFMCYADIKPRNINNPFLDNFPLLKQILFRGFA